MRAEDAVEGPFTRGVGKGSIDDVADVEVRGTAVEEGAEAGTGPVESSVGGGGVEWEWDQE